MHDRWQSMGRQLGRHHMRQLIHAVRADRPINDDIGGVV
jgi:hypothetical protein